MQTATALPIGTPVIYYNLWTRFQTTEFKGQFSVLSVVEIERLKKGDIIYVDIDPLHPNGKVYGRVKTEVAKTIKLEDGEFQVHFSGGSWRGFKTTRGGVSNDIEKANDEETLATIVARLPLSVKIDTYYN